MPLLHVSNLMFLADFNLKILQKQFFKIRKLIAGEVTHLEQREQKSYQLLKKCFK